MSSSSKDNRSNGNGGSKQQHIAEWSMFAVAAIVVAGIIAVFAVAAFGPSQPAAFETRVIDIDQRSGGSYVTVAVENVGDETAADVTVSAKVVQGASVVVQETESLAFLAGDERQRVVFVFDRDVSQEELRVGVSAYRIP